MQEKGVGEMKVRIEEESECSTIAVRLNDGTEVGRYCSENDPEEEAKLMREMLRAVADEERAAIVAWMRDRSSDEVSAFELAGRIEAGEHMPCNPAPDGDHCSTHGDRCDRPDWS